LVATALPILPNPMMATFVFADTSFIVFDLKLFVNIDNTKV
jgi:hypothetical protein